MRQRAYTYGGLQYSVISVAPFFSSTANENQRFNENDAIKYASAQVIHNEAKF